MADLLGPRKRKPVPVDPENSEAIRLEQIRNRKKQRLAAADTEANPAPLKAPTTATTGSAKRANAPSTSRRASVEVVEDEDDVRSFQRPKPKKSTTIIESDDDDIDEIPATVSRPTDRRKTQSSQPADESSESSDDEAEIIEQPQESAEAELSMCNIYLLMKKLILEHRTPEQRLDGTYIRVF